jgi:membrane-associated phospholipid phosphatase
MIGAHALRGQRPGLQPSVATGGGAGRPFDRTSLARAVTEVLAPANLAVVQLLLVSWYSTPGLAGLLWGLLASTFCGLIPYGVVIVGVHRRQWTDRHLRVRHQRPTPFLAAIGSVLTGLALLVALDAPRQLVALVAAMLSGLAATMLVTLWWKVSVHTAAASGTVAILVVTFGPPLFLALPAIALVAWSRIRLGDHAPAQTLAGAALAGLVATIVFILLR